MKIEYLFFIVLSAFLHAFYNFLMRKNSGRRIFMLGMFLFSSIIAVVYTFVMNGYDRIPWQFVPNVYGASFFYMLYLLLVSKAYERGQISKFYPLTVLSPVFIPFWAFLFLGERISVMAGFGILLTLTGAILVKTNALSLLEFKKMFTFDREYLGARLALAASLVYSFGSVLDKSKIAHFTLPAYLAILMCAMTLNGFLFHFILRKLSDSEHKKQEAMGIARFWKSMLLGGIVVYLSFYAFRISLRVVDVSIAVPIRQVSIIFAILLGVLFLKEKFRFENLIGSLVIVAGIILINFGA